MKYVKLLIFGKNIRTIFCVALTVGALKTVVNERHLIVRVRIIPVLIARFIFNFVITVSVAIFGHFQAVETKLH